MNGPEHYNDAELWLTRADTNRDPVAALMSIAHALLALVKTEEEHSDEIVTMAASLAHLADDMSHPDDHAHVGGMVP